jgi:hypothetical protein
MLEERERERREETELERGREEDKILNNNFNKLHQYMHETALSIIPEMLFPTNMITLNGSINNQQITILIDTGASSSVIFKNALDKLDLHDLIDIKFSSELYGIGKETSLGNIWYIELELNNNIYPISLIASNNIVKNFDMILGLNFLQSYKALIDCENKVLILNNKYKINFTL